MSRRKPIDAKILETSRAFDARIFAETVKGEFADCPDYRRNQKRILYYGICLLSFSAAFFVGATRLRKSLSTLLCRKSGFPLY